MSTKNKTPKQYRPGASNTPSGITSQGKKDERKSAFLAKIGSSMAAYARSRSIEVGEGFQVVLEKHPEHGEVVGLKFPEGKAGDEISEEVRMVFFSFLAGFEDGLGKTLKPEDALLAFARRQQIITPEYGFSLSTEQKSDGRVIPTLRVIPEDKDTVVPTELAARLDAFTAGFFSGRN